MKPFLFSSTRTQFYGTPFYMGKGRLDCLSCKITEELNGIFELELKYPSNGPRKDDLLAGGIIGAVYPLRSNSNGSIIGSGDLTKVLEPFDIYKTTIEEDGIITVNAHHVSYRLKNHIIDEVPYTSAYSILATLKSRMIPSDTFFTFTGPLIQGSAFKCSATKSAREYLLDDDYSIKSVYGLDIIFTQRTVYVTSRGIDTHISVRMGKNISDANIIRDDSDTFNAVVAIWENDNTKVTTGIVQPTTAITPIKAATLDLSNAFETQPTVQQLETAAQNWLDANTPWVAWKSTNISIAPQWATPNSPEISNLENIAIGDYVDIFWSEGNLEGEKARVVKCQYDSLKEVYTKLELGDLNSDYVLTNNISGASATAGGGGGGASSIVYLQNVACSAMTGDFATGSDANITADHVIAEIVFANPSAISSDVTWTTAAGSITLNGTCSAATTCDIVLV